MSTALSDRVCLGAICWHTKQYFARGELAAAVGAALGLVQHDGLEGWLSEQCRSFLAFKARP